MRHYELVVILSPMLSAQEAGETWNRIKEFVTGRQAELTHDQRLGTRRLAYAIRKAGHNFLEGNYHLCRFSTETAITRELENFLRVDDRVLRYLTVTTAPPKAVPEPVPTPPAQAAAPVEAAAGASERQPVAAAPTGVGAPAPSGAPGAQPE